MTRLAILLLCLLCPPLSALADETPLRSERETFRVKVLTAGLENPWGLAFLPDGRMLVSERPGRLRVVSADGRLDPRPVAGVPTVTARGQGGLLDVALHPAFADNGWVYLSYAGGGEGGIGTEVARGRWVSDAGGNRLEDLQVIYRQAPKSSGGQHFGSRLVFGRDGFLYISQGDRGEMARA